MDRLAAMETFVQVVDAGSLSAAARQLKVGQSAVSKTIAQLEAWLGVQLLLRSTRSLRPTDAGLAFYERARRTIEEASEAESAARGTAAAVSGKLRVSAAICFARIHILPVLPMFLVQHPGIEIELVLDDRIIDVVEEGIDVALRTGTPGEASLTAHRIGRGRRLVVGSASYFEAHGVPSTPNELAKHRAVLASRPGVSDTFTFTHGATQTPVKLGGSMRVTTMEGVREAVLAGLGLAVVGEWLVTPELALGSIRAVLEDWSLPTYDLWAVHATSRRPSVKAKAFVSYVEGCIKAEAEIATGSSRLSVVHARGGVLMPPRNER